MRFGLRLWSFEVGGQVVCTSKSDYRQKHLLQLARRHVLFMQRPLFGRRHRFYSDVYARNQRQMHFLRILRKQMSSPIHQSRGDLMKFLWIIALLVASLFAAKLQTPSMRYVASGVVTDMVVKEELLYVSTDASRVDVFDLKSGKIVHNVQIDKIKDFMGDEIDAKIFSVDVVDEKILILSQANQGYRRVYVYQNDATRLIIDESLALSIAKAKFLDKNTLLLVLLSDEIISYDIAKKRQNYRVSASASKFSDFVLNEDKTQVAVTDESGDVQLLNTRDGSRIKTFSGQNLDNVFKIDYKNSLIATAGQDRRVVIYDVNSSSSYYKLSSFFVYCVGLSPSGVLAAYSSDENNNVTVFNTKTKSDLAVFTGNKITLSKILFLNENDFLVASDSHVINRYKIK